MATVRHVIEDDPIEMLFERGATDGLPVVPPTRERVERMLAGAPDRQRDELIGALGPCYGEATVEKVAINAVMAGCKPEYFPVVLAGVEALCDERFCAHGLSVTLLSGAPLPKEEIRARADAVIDTLVGRLVAESARAAAL